MLVDVAPCADREQRLEEAILAYLKAADDGRPLTLAQLLEQHPDLGGELSAFFADQEHLNPLLMPLRRLPEAALPRPGTVLRTLGDYELLEEIGRGGMGVVYKARQTNTARLVALKMIRAGELASATDVQRFRNEAESVANLDHPAIVPIYEVGEQDRRLFFSMKLIENGSLAEQLVRYMADPRAAAALVAAVAGAVHHAHQHGVLHRDLKPGNILLDEEGRPYVTDFGLAKRLADNASLTESGILVGTPGYMAPEQVAGRKGTVSTATDVYGLGALLYALLTGKPPFTGDTALTTLEQVRSREPDSPSGRNRRVDRDLESICLKCLEKEPGRRYASAEAVADDLNRWVAGQPVQARPVRRLARLVRWSKRNPMLAGLSLLTGTVLLLGVVGMGLGFFILWQKEQQREFALGQSQDSLRVARRAVDKMFTQFAEDWIGKQPRLHAVQKEFLQEALTFYRDFVHEETTDPAARFELGQVYMKIGRASWQLGQIKEMGDAYLHAIAIFQELTDAYPDEPTYQQKLGSSYKYLGWASGGDWLEPEKAHRQAVAIHERMVARFPDNPECQSCLANSLHNLSDAVPSSAECNGLNRRAVQIWEQLLRTHSPQPDYRTGLCAAYTTLARLDAFQGKCDSALESSRKAIHHSEQLAGGRSRLPEYAHEMNPYAWLNLGRAYQLTGRLLVTTRRPEEAGQAFERALAIQQKLIVDFPDSTRGPFDDLIVNQQELEDVLEAQGKFDTGRASSLQRRDALEQLVADFPSVENQRQLAAYLTSSRYGDKQSLHRARELAEIALRSCQGEPTKAHCAEADCWFVVGQVCYRTGQSRLALDALTKAIQGQLDGPYFPPAYYYLAMLSHALGDRQQANDWYQQALAKEQAHVNDSNAIPNRLQREAVAVFGPRQGAPR